MKKLIIASIFFFVITAISAAAAVTVTYNFYDIHTAQPLDNVDALVYPCNDAVCSSLRLNSMLQGSGNSGSNSFATIIFPTRLATQYGYAAYYFRLGYAPQEYNADWNGNGETRYSIPFNKIYYCKANITDFDVGVTNLDGNVSLNANVRSAFSEAVNNVGYVLPAYIDYYSSLVRTNVTVYDEGNNTVYENMRTDNILMDNHVDFTLDFNLAPGNYTAIIVTKVIDDQCASEITQQRSIDFEIPEQPVENLSVTLTADPMNGSEPLDVRLNCSVENGEFPFNYSFFDEGILFFNMQTDSRELLVNRTFNAGNHTVACFVSGSDGRNDSDSVMITVNATHIPECRDGADNDGDGFIDYLADPGCENPDDDNESDHPHVCENHLNITNVLMNNNDIIELYTYPVNNLDVINGYIPFDYNFTNTGDSAINESSYAETMVNQQTGSIAYHASLLPNFDPYSTLVRENNFTLPSDLINGTYNMTIAVIGNDTFGCTQYDEFRFFLTVNNSNITYECSDGIDNDGDGFIDYLADPGCFNETDDNETDIPHVCENHLNITNVLMNNDYITELYTYPVNNLDVINGYIPFDYNFTNTGDSAINASSYAETMINQQTGSVAYHASLLPDFNPYSTFIEENEFNLPEDLINGTYNMTIAAIGNDSYGCLQYDEFMFFLIVNTSNVTYECSDNADNDGDGYIDYPADPGCENATDDDEYNNNTINEAPLVTLLFPLDNSTFSIGNLIFIYGVVDDHSPLLDCIFYSNITGTFAPMQSQITANGGIGFFNVSGIPDGTYVWNVECSDGLLSAFAPRNWTFTIDTSGYIDIPAEVNITANPETGAEPLDVQFNSSVSGNLPIIYSWTFGDGVVSNVQNPLHNYQHDGTYTATLAITDADGDTASDSVVITVTDSGDGSNGGNGDEKKPHKAEYDLYIGRIKIYSDIEKNYGEEYVKAGQELYVDTFFENLGTKDIEDIKYRVLIPDLGEMNAAKFDLDSGEHVTKRVVLDVPDDAEPGDYDVQISASNEQVRRVKYRFVTVLE